ncbi:MAG: holo-ACP synthase [Lachnospiraceae bacterium]|nr:holo-ACP synthase [Lachnospiraceae bacterium]
MGKIVGIGTDLVEIERVTKAYARESFRQKYYSEQERELIQKKPARAATAFAGKEAVVKAMGTGFQGIMPSDIEILREPSGAPCVRLSGKAAAQARRHDVSGIHISLTDTEKLAMAYVVMES